MIDFSTLNVCDLKSSIKIFFIVSLSLTSITSAQTFGFGCLGLSGFYAGYTQQDYKAAGMNEAINTLITSSFNDAIEFKRGTGYRIGANIFRAKFDFLFITAKGYYQFLKEIHEREDAILNGVNQKFQLSMNHWGVGLDFGIPIFSIIDLKIVEGNVTFYNSELIESYHDQNGVLIIENKYSLDKAKVGYFVGSGLILHLVPDYISVEATAGYSFINIDRFSNSDNYSIPSTDNKAIDKGGFSATVQLNVGFPL